MMTMRLTDELPAGLKILGSSFLGAGGFALKMRGQLVAIGKLKSGRIITDDEASGFDEIVLSLEDYEAVEAIVVKETGHGEAG